MINIRIVDSGFDRYTIEAENTVLGRRFDDNAEFINVIKPSGEEDSVCKMIVLDTKGNAIDFITVGDTPIGIRNTISQYCIVSIGFSFLRQDESRKNSEAKQFVFLNANMPSGFHPVPPEYIVEIERLISEAFVDVEKTNSEINFKNLNGDIVKTIEDLIGAVSSVNGKTGDVVLKTSDIENDSGYITNDLLQAETQARISGDNTLDGKITAETTRATGAENSLQQSITAETTARQSADQTINESIADISADIEALDGRVETTEGNIETLSQGLQEAEQKIQELDTGVTNISEDVADLENEVGDMLDDITTIQSDIAGIQSDVTDIQGDVSDIQGVIPQEASTSNKLVDRAYLEANAPSKIEITLTGESGVLTQEQYNQLVNNGKNVVLVNDGERFYLSDDATSYRTYLSLTTPDDTTINYKAITVNTTAQAVNFRSWSLETVTPTQEDNIIIVESNDYITLDDTMSTAVPALTAQQVTDISSALNSGKIVYIQDKFDTSKILVNQKSTLSGVVVYFEYLGRLLLTYSVNGSSVDISYKESFDKAFFDSNYAPLSFVSNLYGNLNTGNIINLLDTPPTASANNILQLSNSTNTDYDWNNPSVVFVRQVEVDTTLSKTNSLTFTLKYKVSRSVTISWGAKVQYSTDNVQWEDLSSNQSFSAVTITDYSAGISTDITVFMDAIVGTKAITKNSYLRVLLFKKQGGATALTTNLYFGVNVDNAFVCTLAQFNFTNVSIDTEQIKDGSVTKQKLSSELMSELDSKLDTNDTTSQPTANKVIVRDSNGRAQVENPSASKDIANKVYVDSAVIDKVDKVAGKQLSTNDYTDTDKNKLAGIEAGAEVNNVNSVNGKLGYVVLNYTDVGADASGSASTVQGNLNTHTGNTNNPHGVTKSQVGLGNVDNTSDTDKPISTATQNALNNKQDTLVSGTNIKTINNQSILGSGNIEIQGGSSVEWGDTLPEATENSADFAGIIDDGLYLKQEEYWSPPIVDGDGLLILQAYNAIQSDDELEVF